MLELLVMIGVMGWFSREANSRGRSGFLWGCIGAISYYGPVIVFGQFIFPEMVKEMVTYGNQGQFMAIGLILNIAVGVGCCFLARTFLLSLDANTAQNNTRFSGAPGDNSGVQPSPTQRTIDYLSEM